MSFSKLRDEFEEDLIKEHDSAASSGADFELVVFNKWISLKKFIPLIVYFNGEYDSAWGNRHSELIKFITVALIKSHRRSELRLLWKTAIQTRNATYHDYLRSCSSINNNSLQEIICNNKKELRERLLAGIDEYDKALAEIGEMDHERSKLKEFRAKIIENKKPKPKPTTDKRKMDESVFWEVIAEARAAVEFSFEVTERLKEKLEAMNVTAIKKFDKLFRQKVAALYRWDLWALAYIMNGGCGDDAFEYFRAGLVIQGKEFYELAFSNIINLAEKLNAFDGDIECEQALSIAENAYSDKTGDFMPYQDIDMPDIQGEKWEEEDLPKRYPELCKIFSWAG
jgi:hypothetical protein